MTQPAFTRMWAMPSPDTFSIPQLRQIVRWHLERSRVSVDPFARNNRWAMHTNDLDPATAAEHHMDAVEFLDMLNAQSVRADLVICDPPYSPSQIVQCYRAIGKRVEAADGQNAALMARVRAGIERITTDDATVLWFGWNSTGMGSEWQTNRVILICHGGAHNDTICVEQTRLNRSLLSPEMIASNVPAERRKAPGDASIINYIYDFAAALRTTP